LTTFVAGPCERPRLLHSSRLKLCSFFNSYFLLLLTYSRQKKHNSMNLSKIIGLRFVPKDFSSTSPNPKRLRDIVRSTVLIRSSVEFPFVPIYYIPGKNKKAFFDFSFRGRF